MESHIGRTYQAGGLRVSVHFCAWQSDQIACEGEGKEATKSPKQKITGNVPGHIF